MGGIGIWCMHFIGNRAIVLGEGEPHVQAMYNVAFTGTSFVLPVVVLLFAFYAVGVEEKAGYIRILIGGLLTGSAVCGMHYIGQLGISNYRCSYHVANVVGSAVIAIVSSTAALGIFFRWRAGRIAGGDEESVLAYWHVLYRACIGLRLLERSIGITTA